MTIIIFYLILNQEYIELHYFTNYNKCYFVPL